MMGAALAFNIFFLWFKVARPTGLGTTMKKDFFKPCLTLTGGRYTHFPFSCSPAAGGCSFSASLPLFPT